MIKKYAHSLQIYLAMWWHVIHFTSRVWYCKYVTKFKQSLKTSKAKVFHREQKIRHVPVGVNTDTECEDDGRDKTQH